MNLVIMGVSGVGKTTLGMALAKTLGRPYIEGDAFHSAANRQKMASAIALTDDDRWPWLDALVNELNTRGEPLVLACSALKVRYRDRLRASELPLRFVWLRGTESLINARLRERRGHYMPAALLRSQLDALEPPLPTEQVLEISVDQPAPALLTAIMRELGLNPRSA